MNTMKYSFWVVFEVFCEIGLWRNCLLIQFPTTTTNPISTTLMAKINRIISDNDAFVKKSRNKSRNIIFNPGFSKLVKS